jgi:peptidoglycan hydrolase flgJ
VGYVPKNPMSDADVQAKKLREACEGFEAMFLSMMYKQMRATVPESGLFGKKSNAIKIFEDMRDTELMNAAAKSGGIGLADMMYKQLSPTVIKK